MSHPAPVIELVQPLSVGERTLAEMRAMFGRNSAASFWSRLSKKERAIACFAADISPELGQHMELEQFEAVQQEALRAALVLVQGLGKKSDGPVLDRHEWHRALRSRRQSTPQRAQVAPTNAPPEPVSRDDLLASRNALMKKINGPVGQPPEPQALYDEE